MAADIELDPAWQAFVRACVATGRYGSDAEVVHAALHLLRKTGSGRHAGDSAAAGEADAAAGAARGRADDAHRRTERRLVRLMESNIIGVTFCDEERVIEANDAYLALTGYSRDDLEAGRLLWRNMTPPEYLAIDEKAIAEIRACGACVPFEKEYYLSLIHI